jgi:hypothetical protein
MREGMEKQPCARRAANAARDGVSAHQSNGCFTPSRKSNLVQIRNNPRGMRDKTGLLLYISPLYGFIETNCNVCGAHWRSFLRSLRSSTEHRPNNADPLKVLSTVRERPSFTRAVRMRRAVGLTDARSGRRACRRASGSGCCLRRRHDSTTLILPAVQLASEMRLRSALPLRPAQCQQSANNRQCAKNSYPGPCHLQPPSIATRDNLEVINWA